ncbi:MAG: tRNA-intron endonuclease, archaea type [archaeon GW2011_AR5]|nr:MAG: tRNA-intron endonuclease, archaea type [archaeon GW2011_AR5]
MPGILHSSYLLLGTSISGDNMSKKNKKSGDSMEQADVGNEYIEPEPVKIVVDTILAEDKVIATENREHVYEPGYYGKELGERLELAMVEATLLLKRGRIRVSSLGKLLTFKELYDHACSIDKRFPHKYRVYEDLRERGLLVRTGFKFGCDFRVYERGVQLKKGPKSAKEHTKWIVFSVPEDFTMSFAELSRSVRLAHNIRARMLWAVVDNESDVTFYQITRHKP